MGDSARDTKICPFCAEEIKAAAIKCRYCQSDLAPSSPLGSDIGTAEVVPGPPLGSDIGTADVVPGPPLGSDIGTADVVPGVRRSRLPRVSMPMLVVLLVLSVMAAGTAGWFAFGLRHMKASDEARTAGQVTAADYVEKLLSYNYKTFDKDEAGQKKLTAGKFAKQYASTMGMVRDQAVSTQTVVKASVVATSVISAEPNEMRALLFVNQVTTGKQTKEPRVDQNRVVVTLTKDDDGGWLISDLDAL